MHIKIRNFLSLFTVALLLAACNGFFEKDNTPSPTPLTRFREEVKPRLLWLARAGYGVGDEYLKVSPALDDKTIYTSSSRGTVTSINKTNGRVNWQVDTYLPITSGPAADDGIVVFGTRKGDVEALHETDGRRLWTVNVHGEVLAKPAIEQGVVIIKTVNGYVLALSAQDGHELWSFQQVEPNLILRGSSSPLIGGRSIIVGFANGTLAKLGFNEGQLLWQQTIAVPEGAFAIQRMIDIDADPIIFQHHIYAATYQGKIASLDWVSGRIRWSQDISSYTGMIADDDTVYISDAKSHLWAFNADSGFIKWRQDSLEARGATGPAMIDDYIIVGDSEGYLHWLDKRDGHFVARIKIKGAGALYSAPIVENNVLYALTSSGYLAAYTLS